MNKLLKKVVSSVIYAELDWEITETGDNRLHEVCHYMESLGRNRRTFLFFQYYYTALVGKNPSVKSKSIPSMVAGVAMVLDIETKKGKLEASKEFLTIQSELELRTFSMLDKLLDLLIEDTYSEFNNNPDTDPHLFTKKVLNKAFAIFEYMGMGDFLVFVNEREYINTEVKLREDRVKIARKILNEINEAVKNKDKLFKKADKEAKKASEEIKLRKSQKKSQRIANIIYERIAASQARYNQEQQRIKEEAISSQNAAQELSDSIENNTRADSVWWEERARPNGELKKSASVFHRGDEDADSIKNRSKALHSIK